MSMEETASFVVALGRCAPAGKAAIVVAREALTICRDAERLHSLYEAACCRDLLPREEKRIESLEQRVRDALAAYGVTDVTFNPDPRGSPVKAKLPTGESNGDWSGEGRWCL